MKWLWVLMAVLVMPGAAPAKQSSDELVHFDGIGLSEKGYRPGPATREDWPFPNTTYFGVSARQELDDVSLNMELLIEPSVSAEQLQAGHCAIYWRSKPERQAEQMFPIHQGDDLDIWFPHLAKRTQVVIGWPDPVEDIAYMTTTMRSTQRTAKQPWRDAGNILRRRKAEHPAPLRTVRLNDIYKSVVAVFPKE